MIWSVVDGRDSVCFCHSSSVVISMRVDIVIEFDVPGGDIGNLADDGGVFVARFLE